ncbi:MAG: V-type ATP synthase subunit F [Treponema sp.]|jgi:V/A-type H+-transporting ATPase subunit F|nr:V-type ATP synthase subunit F [Treponema sp.]
MDYYFIGDPELVTAFHFVGIGGRAVADSGEAQAAFLRITRGLDETAGVVLPGEAGKGCRVLIITEEVADWLGHLLIDWQLSDRYPLVVEIPGILGRLPGRKTLVDSIREAIGIHV